MWKLLSAAISICKLDGLCREGWWWCGKFAMPFASVLKSNMFCTSAAEAVHIGGSTAVTSDWVHTFNQVSRVEPSPYVLDYLGTYYLKWFIGGWRIANIKISGWLSSCGLCTCVPSMISSHASRRGGVKRDWRVQFSLITLFLRTLRILMLMNFSLSRVLKRGKERRTRLYEARWMMKWRSIMLRTQVMWIFILSFRVCWVYYHSAISNLCAMGRMSCLLDY